MQCASEVVSTTFVYGRNRNGSPALMAICRTMNSETVCGTRFFCKGFTLSRMFCIGCLVKSLKEGQLLAVPLFGCADFVAQGNIEIRIQESYWDSVDNFELQCFGQAW